jgi:hypothetical protein
MGFAEERMWKRKGDGAWWRKRRRAGKWVAGWRGRMAGWRGSHLAKVAQGLNLEGEGGGISRGGRGMHAWISLEDMGGMGLPACCKRPCDFGKKLGEKAEGRLRTS